MDPRRRAVYTLKITEVHPKIVHAPRVVMNDITVVHDETDPGYDPVLAAKYDSAHAAASPGTSGTPSETSTVSATDDAETSGADRQLITERFRQEKAAHFVATQRLGRGTASRRGRGAKLHGSLPTVRTSSSEQRQRQLPRSGSFTAAAVSNVACSQSRVATTPNIGGLSSSTLKLLGMSQRGSPTAASLHTSSSGVNDAVCHDDVLLTMAERLNAAAARSSRNAAAGTCDSIDTAGHRSAIVLPVSSGSQDSDSSKVCLQRAMQTDGPPYHDHENNDRDTTEVRQSSSAVAVSSEDSRGDECVMIDDLDRAVTGNRCVQQHAAAGADSCGRVASWDPNCLSAQVADRSGENSEMDYFTCDSDIGDTVGDLGMDDNCAVRDGIVCDEKSTISDQTLDSGKDCGVTSADECNTEKLFADRLETSDDLQSSDDKVCHATSDQESFSDTSSPDCSEPMDRSSDNTIGEQSFSTSTDQCDVVNCDVKECQSTTEEESFADSSIPGHLTTTEPVSHSSGNADSSSCGAEGRRAKVPCIILHDVVKSGLALVDGSGKCRINQSTILTHSTTSSTASAAVAITTVASLSASELAACESLATVKSSTVASLVSVSAVESTLGSTMASVVPASVSTAFAADNSSLVSVVESSLAASCVSLSAAESVAPCTVSAAVALPTASLSSIASALSPDAELSAADEAECSSSSVENVIAASCNMDDIPLSTTNAWDSESVNYAEHPLPASLSSAVDSEHDDDFCSIPLSPSVPVSKTTVSQQDLLLTEEAGLETDVDEDFNVMAAAAERKQTASSAAASLSSAAEAIVASSDSSSLVLLLSTDTESLLDEAVDSADFTDLPLADEDNVKALTSAGDMDADDFSHHSKDNIKVLTTTCDSNAADIDLHLEANIKVSTTACDTDTASIDLHLGDNDKVSTSACDNGTTDIDLPLSLPLSPGSTDTVASEDDDFCSSPLSPSVPVSKTTVSQQNAVGSVPGGIVQSTCSLSVEAADSIAVSRPLTCSVSSLQQLLASAKQSRPFFVHVVPHGAVATSAAVPSSVCVPPGSYSSTMNSQLSAAKTPHTALLGKCKLSGDNSQPASVSAASHLTDAPSPAPLATAVRIKRLLESDDEPIAKRMHVTGDADMIAGKYRLAASQTEHQSSSSPSLDTQRGITASESASSPSLDSQMANQSGYRLARATTNIRDHWAVPKTAVDHNYYHHPPTVHMPQPCSEPRDWQITLRPSIQPTGSISTQCHNQPGNLKITLQSGYQPSILFDRSNYSVSLHSRGRRGYQQSHVSSRTTRTGPTTTLTYLLTCDM